MAKKKTTTKADDDLLLSIKANIINDMEALGLNPASYSIAVDLASTTLYEREKAYEAYKENGSRQTTEDGKTNPYAVRLQSWNSQARACLTMLRLTPPYIKADGSETTDEPENLDDILTT